MCVLLFSRKLEEAARTAGIQQTQKEYKALLDQSQSKTSYLESRLKEANSELKAMDKHYKDECEKLCLKIDEINNVSQRLHKCTQDRVKEHLYDRCFKAFMYNACMEDMSKVMSKTFLFSSTYFDAKMLEYMAFSSWSSGVSSDNFLNWQS